MATEFEFKYVLSLDTKLPEADESVLIQQGYLATSPITVRIRRIKPLAGGKSQWYYTFKKGVGNRVIEIETTISRRDGKDLWKLCTNKIQKRRYSFLSEKQRWDIDYFLNADGEVYLVMAEVELPEGSARPLVLPKYLRKHVYYGVNLNDDRFSNKNLGDVEYATNLFNLVKKGIA